MTAGVLASRDLTSALLAFLSPSDLAKSLPTCQDFKACALQAFKVQARSQKEVSLKQLWEGRLFLMNSIRKIDANYTEILDYMPNVKSVTLNCMETSPFAFLEGAVEEMLLSTTTRSLTDFSITSILSDTFTDEHLQQIAKECRLLRRLEIHRFIVPAHSPDIDRLISDEGMKALEHLSQLQLVSIHYAPSITDKTLEVFAKMSSLLSVTLSKCNVTEQGIASFQSATADRKVTFKTE